MEQCHVLHGSRNRLNWTGKRMKAGTWRGSWGQVVWALCQRSLGTPESQCASYIELVEKQVYYMQRNKEVGYYILIRKETVSMIYIWVQKRQVGLISVGAVTVAEESLRHRYLGGESYGGYFLCTHQHQHPRERLCYFPLWLSLGERYCRPSMGLKLWDPWHNHAQVYSTHLLVMSVTPCSDIIPCNILNFFGFCFNVSLLNSDSVNLDSANDLRFLFIFSRN